MNAFRCLTHLLRESIEFYIVFIPTSDNETEFSNSFTIYLYIFPFLSRRCRRISVQINNVIGCRIFFHQTLDRVKRSSVGFIVRRSVVHRLIMDDFYTSLFQFFLKHRTDIAHRSFLSFTMIVAFTVRHIRFSAVSMIYYYKRIL